MKILIVDDDRDLTELLVFALKRAGFIPLVAHDAPEALDAFVAELPALVVLDINLGASNGLDLLGELRRRGSTPVILLTGLASEDDKVRGLELGADDYLTKPFGHRELVARIRARLRVGGGAGGGVLLAPEAGGGGAVLRAGPLTLNVAEHTVSKDGEPINLTVTEFRLLRYLMSNAGIVVRTGALLRQVWGYDDPTAADVVRVTLHRLRRKLEDDPASPRLLHTVPGVGVVFRPEPQPAAPQP